MLFRSPPDLLQLRRSVVPDLAVLIDDTVDRPNDLRESLDPRVIRIAACIAIVVSFCPKFAALVSAMPTATIGGVSLVLYGMISAVGVRNVVENKVDFTNTRNVIIAALILVLAIGITYSGSIQIGVVSLSGLAV